MEKQTQSHTKTKNNFLKFLPKAASSVYFQNPPFSPNRDKRTDHRVKPHAAGKGFSGPIISIIPDEARRRCKNGSTNSFYTQEPTSPKISCMGQIKHKKKTMNKKSNNNDNNNRKNSDPVVLPPSTPQIKKPSAIKRLLTGSSKPDHERRRSDASVYDKQPLSDRAPSLSQMKRFASGRETLSNFDWSSQFTPVASDRRNFYSDEEEDEEEEIIIPFSAPIIVGSAMSLQPRKEVNLWKRRTMDPPKPLQLNLNG